MKTFKELEICLKHNIPLIWKDPDPIPGVDYTITKVEKINYKNIDTPILIQYGNGSEAEVLLKEILIK